MKKKTKRSRKSKKHPWDDTMVKVVMVVSTFAILLLLASHISVTGEAVATPDNIKETLHNSETIVGDGNCNDICAIVDGTCTLAVKERKNKPGYVLGKCTTRSTQVTCVCTKS